MNSNNSKPRPPDELPQICCSPKVAGLKTAAVSKGKTPKETTKALRETQKQENKGIRASCYHRCSAFVVFSLSLCLLLNLWTGTARVLSLRRARYAFSQTLLICATEVDGTEPCNGRYQRCDWLFLQAFRGVLSRSFLAPPSSCGQCCSLVGVEYGPVGPVLAKAPGPPPLEESP